LQAFGDRFLGKNIVDYSEFKGDRNVQEFKGDRNLPLHKVFNGS
jgi:hypothetical protein